MRDLLESDRSAVAVSSHYSRVNFDVRKVYCFEDPPKIRSNSVLLKMRDTGLNRTEWNNLIQRIFESGLITKWANSAIASAKTCKGNDPTKEGIVTSDQSMGMFVFMACGYILAAIAAILEQIIHYKVKQENHHRYWDLADKLIDARRHMFIFNARGNNRNRN